MMRAWGLAAALAVSMSAAVVSGDDAQRLLGVDHFVRVTSTVPAIAGQPAQLYVRERVLAGTALRGRSFENRVVLFVHGAGTPAEVSFDVPYQDYSWMGHLARAGFDVFSVDMTGYGRSTRPFPMNDPCNLAPDRQAGFTAPCKASYPGNLTTIASDWDDVGAAVDYIRALRRVDRVSLVAWSLGGPRAGGYAARNPQKVNRLVLLAPGYNRQMPAAAPAKLPVEGVVFNTQSRAEFDANWERQVGCPAQVRPGGPRLGVERDARLRSGGRVVGTGRAPRAADHDLGLGYRHGGEADDADADRAGHPRQAGASGARPGPLRGPWRAGEGAGRSRVRLAQRDVGKGRAHAALQRLTRVARQGHGERRQDWRAQARILTGASRQGK